MLAAILEDFNHLEEVRKPEPGPGEVLVRIKSCGYCATDYTAIKGIRRNVDFPLLPGHEPAGIIAGVGPHVSNVKKKETKSSFHPAVFAASAGIVVSG